MELQTNRTILKPVDSSDLLDIHALHLLPEIDQYNTLGIPKDISETQSIVTSWVKNHQETEITNYTFSIRFKENNNFIGLLGFKLGSKKYKRAEVWYKIHSNHWNKGYATETLITVLNFGFDQLKLHRIQAGCAVDNIGSIKVLEKVGMIREGRGRKILPLASGWSDNFEYAILENDKRLKVF